MSENQQYQTPTFHDGEPVNLEAAALDALDWLKWGKEFLKHNYHNRRRDTILYRLGRAIAALEEFLPDETPLFTETPKSPEFGAVAEIGYPVHPEITGLEERPKRPLTKSPPAVTWPNAPGRSPGRK